MRRWLWNLFCAISLLIFTETESTAESYVLLAAIFFFLIYLTRLLSILDTPFQPRVVTFDRVGHAILKTPRFEEALRQANKEPITRPTRDFDLD